MKYIICICLSLCIVCITGCSSKIEQNKDNKIHLEQENVITKDDSLDEFDEDAFLDEFEEEMEVDTKSDPFSGYNRVMTSFNDGVYEYALSPVARGYKFVVHKEIRTGIGNFFHNILFPIRFVNNLLQGKFKNTAEETGRFLINSTFGLLGLFDPAKRNFGWESHDEDFGQTLGFYGVGAGPHIVLPFLGPSNLRDALSLYPDALLSPIEYNEDRAYNLTKNYKESIFVKAYERVNAVSLNPEQYEKLKKDAIDLYPYLRDVYEQFREKEIKE